VEDGSQGMTDLKHHDNLPVERDLHREVQAEI